MTATSGFGLPRGYRIYRDLDPRNVDCKPMRQVNDHARHLGRLIGSLELRPGMGSPDADVAEELGRVQQWLVMAGGLKFVSVERYPAQSRGYCSTADAYEDADTGLASNYATEQTRLLYTWSAVERRLRAMDLPPIPNRGANQRRYNQATLLLSEGVPASRLPQHYMGVLEHLQRHVARDAHLAGEKGLQDANDERPWRSVSGLLLSIGAALRNIPSHGTGTVPRPTADWDEDVPEAASEALPRFLHAPRLGVRGLLISIQMLLSLASQFSPGGSYDEPSFGWWIQRDGGPWFEQ